MAEQTKKERKKKARINHRVRVIMIAVIIGVVVAGLIGGGWLLVSRFVQERDRGEDMTREQELASTATDAERAASESDNPDDAAEIYDEAVRNTDDNQEKAELLASKATAYFNAEQYDKALEAALQADELHDSSMITALIAQIYEAQGNEAQAAEHYRRAANQVEDDNPMSESDRNYYNMKADQLGGGE